MTAVFQSEARDGASRFTVRGAAWAAGEAVTIGSPEPVTQVFTAFPLRYHLLKHGFYKKRFSFTAFPCGITF